MAFVVQCPFCKLRAQVPDRANGAIGRCPKCANSFTLAADDDQHLPESVAPIKEEPETDAEPAGASSVAVAIAVAVVSAKDSVPTDLPVPPASSEIQPAAAAGGLALLFSGIALIFASISFLRGFVIPLSALALAMGFSAIVIARLSARPRLLLPIAGSSAAATLLVIAWFFPALLGGFSQRRDPPSVGLQAIPLHGSPPLAEAPEWTDAKRYALKRDGLRVQVVHAALLHQDATDTKPAHDLLLVRVRIGLDRDAKPPQRKDQPAPLLTDDAGKAYPLRQNEFLDRGDGKSKSGLFPVPIIEETFAFDAPPEDCKTLRLELPAARWNGNGVFQFRVAVPGGAIPQSKDQ